MKYPVTEKKWAVCPICGAKVCVIDNRSSAKGVYIKCTRGCRNVFELRVKDGKQEQLS